MPFLWTAYLNSVFVVGVRNCSLVHIVSRFARVIDTVFAVKVVSNVGLLQVQHKCNLLVFVCLQLQSGMDA